MSKVAWRAGGVLVAVSVAVTAGGMTGAHSAPHAAAKVHHTPHLTATVTGKHLKVSGPTTFKTGRIDVSIRAVGGERELSIASFKKGYSFKALVADEKAFAKDVDKNGQETRAGIKLLDHALAKTTFYGGLDATEGQHESASVVLPKAGDYYMWNDDNVPTDPVKLTATGPVVKRAVPAFTATVTGTSADKFGGDKVLPAKGTIRFKDTTKGSMKSPHFLELVHVKKGTTRKDILNFFQNGHGAPSFALKGSAGTDSVNPGLAQTLTYHLHKGTYAELCFFPDPKTGIPHALMGMIGIVTLK